VLDFHIKSLKTIKQRLLKDQKEVEKNIKEVEADDPATAPSLVESSEPGTDSYIADAHTKDVALKEQLKKVSDGIHKALTKLRKGSYGKCEKCGKQIELKRLLAMPIAEYCLKDSKKASK